MNWVKGLVEIRTNGIFDQYITCTFAVGRNPIGRSVKDCTVDSIDLEQQRMSVILPDPEVVLIDKSLSFLSDYPY